MKSRLPSPTSLRTFEAVVRLGSIQAAAAELGRVPSAISHQLSTLEAELGAALFRKEGRRRTLTDDGRVYAQAVQEAFAEIAQAGEMFVARQVPKALRLRSGSLFMTYALGPKLIEFRHAHPEIALEIDVDDHGIASFKPGVDAAVTLAERAPAGMVSEMLWRTRWLPVATPDYAEKIGGIIPAEQLVDLPLIHVRNFPNLWDLWFAKYLPHQAPPAPSMFAEGGASMLQLLQSGLDGVGIGMFPLLTPLVKSGRLRILLDAPMTGLDYRLVYPHHLSDSWKIRSLRAWLSAVGRELTQMEKDLRLERR